MPLEIVLTEAAEADLDSIDEFLAQYNLDAAEALTAEIQRRFDWLVRFPQGGRLRPEFGADVRTFAVGRRAVIAYRVADGRLLILRILSAGRDVDAAMSRQRSDG